MSFGPEIFYAILAVYFGTSFISLVSYYVAKHNPLFQYSRNVSAIIYTMLLLFGLVMYALNKKCGQLKLTGKAVILILKNIIKIMAVWIAYFFYLEQTKKEMNKYAIVLVIIAQAYINIITMNSINQDMEEIVKEMNCKLD